MAFAPLETTTEKSELSDWILHTLIHNTPYTAGYARY